MAKSFSHSHFGTEARVEWLGREVRLIFTAHTPQQAGDFAREIVRQLKIGTLNLTLMGEPTSVIESFDGKPDKVN